MHSVFSVMLSVALLGVLAAADASVQINDVSGKIKHVAESAFGMSVPAPLSESGMAESSKLDGNWEDRFKEGMRRSKAVTDAEDWPMHDWVIDKSGSGGGIPREMFEAEELLLAAQRAPDPQAKKEKTAELALRLYNHAKWLAERNFARSAEWRYRQAHTFARQSRRSTLAAHSLSRLGYFLMHWRRHDEAREVLRESEKISSKSNPLAPYLLGVLERQVAGPDVKLLAAAEDRILNAKEQPSEELELERKDLVWEINYWRNTEHSMRNCFESLDAARLSICLFMHAFRFMGGAASAL